MAASLVHVTPVMGVHIFVGIGAIFVGISQIFLIPKKTEAFKRVGVLWVLLMGGLVLTSIDIRLVNEGGFSPVHGLSLVVLVLLGLGVVGTKKEKEGVQKFSLYASFGVLMFVLVALIATPGGVMNQWFLGA